MQSIQKKRGSRMSPWKTLYFDSEKHGISEFAQVSRLI
jgi:hypothetical protein